MRCRPLHIAISLSIVLATYWAYALVVVPWIEPPAPRRARTGITPDDIRGTDPEQKFLGIHFPAGSWQLDHPKVLESNNAKLLLKTYRNLRDGRVELTPCTMIFYPHGVEDDQQRERRAVVLDAAEGAILQFDRPLNLRRGTIGNLLGGRLVGPIVIRGRDCRPGADLRIETRDVELNSEFVWTPHPVTFQLGPNRGSGRDMRIVLTRGKGGGAKHGLNFGGLESFELARDVRMHVELGDVKLLPEREHGPRTPSGREQTEDSPVDVRCEGPFRFDLQRYLATFEERVDVVRHNPRGPSDQMSCEVLSIQFAPKPGAATAASQAQPDKTVLPPLEPRYLEARGHPVVVEAYTSGRQGRARCEVLGYDVAGRRIRLTGSQPIELVERDTEVHARSLDYRIPRHGRLGQLEAAGPGTIRARLGEQQDEVFSARWDRKLSIRPHEEQKLISLDGAAEIELSAAGTMSADQLWLWVRELASGGPQLSGTHSQGLSERQDEGGSTPVTPLAGDVKARPTKMMARGRVRIRSPQLEADTGEMTIWFRELSAADVDVNTPRGRPFDPGDTPGDEPGQQFKCSSDVLKIELAMQGRRAELAHATLSGNVQFQETHTQRPAELPLLLRGDTLEVLHANRPETTVAVAGSPARVEARGLVLDVGNLHLDRGTNMMRARGPGRLTVPADPRAGTEKRGQFESFTVAWQGGMTFDGLTARCRQGIVAEAIRQVETRSGTQRHVSVLGSEVLEATLRQKVIFGRRMREEQARLEEVLCGGDFFLANRAFDGDRLAAFERLRGHDLALNERTGDVTAAGPGWVTTVRTGESPLRLRAEQKVRGEQPERQNPGLTYLNVQFQRSMTGNLHRHEATFADLVRARYGPVSSWDATIETDDAGPLPEGAVLLESDRLSVAQVGGTHAGRGMIELEARGNASVEGRQFAAWADRMSYAEEKDLLILEGTGRADAVINRLDQAGGRSSRAAARKILYWLSSRHLKIDEAPMFDFTIGRAGGF